MAAFGSQFTQPIDRVLNEEMDFRMQYLIKLRGMVTYISLKLHRLHHLVYVAKGVK